MKNIILEKYKEMLNEKSILNDEFWKWFGDSKVVDSNGNPLVVYHGTNTIFNKFEKRKIGASNLYGNGFYFTEDFDIANTYIEKNKRYIEKKNPNVHSVYLSLQNPLDMDVPVSYSDIVNAMKCVKINLYWKHLNDEIFNILEKMGYDISNVKSYEKAYKDLAKYEIIEKSIDSRGYWYGGYHIVSEIKNIASIYGMFEFIKDHNNGHFKFPPHNGQLNWQCLYYLLTDYNWSVTNSEKLTKYLHKNYDGIKHVGGWNIGEKEHTVWIAFSPNQIKSIDNKGSWSSNTNNIYESIIDTIKYKNETMEIYENPSYNEWKHINNHSRGIISPVGNLYMTNILENVNAKPSDILHTDILNALFSGQSSKNFVMVEKNNGSIVLSATDRNDPRAKEYFSKCKEKNPHLNFINNVNK
jgi:hypothetical protein